MVSLSVAPARRRCRCRPSALPSSLGLPLAEVLVASRSATSHQRVPVSAGVPLHQLTGAAYAPPPHPATDALQRDVRATELVQLALTRSATRGTCGHRGRWILRSLPTALAASTPPSSTQADAARRSWRSRRGLLRRRSASATGSGSGAAVQLRLHLLRLLRHRQRCRRSDRRLAAMFWLSLRSPPAAWPPAVPQLHLASRRSRWGLSDAATQAGAAAAQHAGSPSGCHRPAQSRTRRSRAC